MKASEVFDLPVSVNHPFTAEVKIGADSVGGDVCVEFHGSKQAWVAANCINHADSLADALDACMSIIGYSSDVCIENERAYHQALQALAAYRGAK